MESVALRSSTRDDVPLSSGGVGGLGSPLAEPFWETWSNAGLRLGSDLNVRGERLDAANVRGDSRWLSAMTA